MCEKNNHYINFLERFKIDRDNSLFLVIDIQERLTKAMFNKEELLKNAKKIIEFANIFSIPIIFTEQNPNALGSTAEELKSCAEKSETFFKMEFSTFVPEFENLLKSYNKKHIVLFGLETHVCVYQSTRDLLLNGYHVTIVNDAVGSRTQKNYENGLELMSKMGAIISNTETVIFDILHTSTDPNFKKAQALIK